MAENLSGTGASVDFGPPPAVKPGQDPRGIVGKFHVARVDGRDAPGGPKAGAEYFVLDYRHDPDAWAAAASYAVTCMTRRPVLARDLARRLLSVLPLLEADPAAKAHLADVFDGPVDKSESWVLLVRLATS